MPLQEWIRMKCPQASDVRWSVSQFSKCISLIRHGPTTIVKQVTVKNAFFPDLQLPCRTLILWDLKCGRSVSITEGKPWYCPWNSRLLFLCSGGQHCLRSVKRCSRCSAVSSCHLLIHWSCWISSRFSRSCVVSLVNLSSHWLKPLLLCLLFCLICLSNWSWLTKVNIVVRMMNTRHLSWIKHDSVPWNVTHNHCDRSGNDCLAPKMHLDVVSLDDVKADTNHTDRNIANSQSHFP